MNFWDVYVKGKDLYKNNAKGEYSERDLMCIFEECFGCNRCGLILSKSKAADDALVQKFFSMIKRRISGEPLQYILNKWSFMGISLKVGEGVLIPRDDTEVLAQKALDYLKHIKSPKIIDLCSGSGAIAVFLEKSLKDAEVTALELSDKAYKYLSENIKNNNSGVKAIKGDVNLKYSEFKDNYFDAVVSNPPYIPSKDIKFLQKEVQKEPRMALDGGKDGLCFYRSICKNWRNKIKDNGILAVEIGIGECENVREIFLSGGFRNVISFKDINSIERVIIGQKLNNT